MREEMKFVLYIFGLCLGGMAYLETRYWTRAEAKIWIKNQESFNSKVSNILLEERRGK